MTSGQRGALRNPAAVGAGDLELVAVQVDRMVGHRQVADADAHLVALRRTTSGSMPGKTRLLKVQRLKSSIVLTFGVVAAGLDVVGVEQEHEVAVDRGDRRVLRGWVTKKPIMPIAICTISSACGWYMKVPGCCSDELVDEGLAGRDVRLRQAGDAVHAVRAGSWPCQWMVVCSGSLLVTKMRTRSPSTTSMVGPGDWPL